MPEPKNITLKEEGANGSLVYPKTSIEQVEGLDTYLEGKGYLTSHQDISGLAEKAVIFKLDVTKIAAIEKTLEDGKELGTLATDSIVLNEKTEAELIQAIDDAVDGIRDLKIIACKCKTNKSGEYKIDKEYALGNITVERKDSGKRKLKANGVLNADCIAKIELNTAVDPDPIPEDYIKPTTFDRTDIQYNEYDSETEPSKYLSKTLLGDAIDGLYGLKIKVVNGKPTFEWALEKAYFMVSADFIKQPTQPEIQQSVAADALTGVEVNGNEIIVRGHLADIVAHLSSNPHQQDAEHKWFGLEINTGLDTLIGTSYQGSALSAEDEAEASLVGCAAGSFVLYLKAEVIAETPTTFTLTRDGYEAKTISVRFVEEEPVEEPVGE